MHFFDEKRVSWLRGICMHSKWLINGWNNLFFTELFWMIGKSWAIKIYDTFFREFYDDQFQFFSLRKTEIRWEKCKNLFKAPCSHRLFLNFYPSFWFSIENMRIQSLRHKIFYKEGILHFLVHCAFLTPKRSLTKTNVQTFH